MTFKYEGDGRRSSVKTTDKSKRHGQEQTSRYTKARTRTGCVRAYGRRSRVRATFKHVDDVKNAKRVEDPGVRGSGE